VNIEDASGLSTKVSFQPHPKKLRVVAFRKPLTGHARYNSHVCKLSLPTPCSWVLPVIFREVKKLKNLANENIDELFELYLSLVRLLLIVMSIWQQRRGFRIMSEHQNTVEETQG
jgi:hypothetical protein